jgi:hypothetical protein
MNDEWITCMHVWEILLLVRQEQLGKVNSEVRTLHKRGNSSRHVVNRINGCTLYLNDIVFFIWHACHKYLRRRSLHAAYVSEHNSRVLTLVGLCECRKCRRRIFLRRIASRANLFSGSALLIRKFVRERVLKLSQEINHPRDFFMTVIIRRVPYDQRRP